MDISEPDQLIGFLEETFDFSPRYQAACRFANDTCLRRSRLARRGALPLVCFCGSRRNHSEARFYSVNDSARLLNPLACPTSCYTGQSHGLGKSMLSAYELGKVAFCEMEQRMGFEIGGQPRANLSRRRRTHAFCPDLQSACLASDLIIRLFGHSSMTAICLVFGKIQEISPYSFAPTTFSDLRSGLRVEAGSRVWRCSVMLLVSFNCVPRSIHLDRSRNFA
jgi:hypothetical protein